MRHHFVAGGAVSLQRPEPLAVSSVTRSYAKSSRGRLECVVEAVTALWFTIIGVLLCGMALANTHLARLPLTPSMLYLAAGIVLGPEEVSLGRGEVRGAPSCMVVPAFDADRAPYEWLPRLERARLQCLRLFEVLR